MSRKERLEKWASDLTTLQMRGLLVQMVSDAIDSEGVCFYDESLAPYWRHCGEPLVEGQECFPDDDEDDKPDPAMICFYCGEDGCDCDML